MAEEPTRPPKDDKIENEIQQDDKGLRLAVIIGISSLTLILIGFIVFLLKPEPVKKVEIDDKIEEIVTEFDKEDASVPKPKAVYELDSIIVNLSETNGTRYLKVTPALEFSGKKSLEGELELREAQIREIMIDLLGSQTVEQVLDLDHRMKLKQIILKRINANLRSGKLMSIFFYEFIVQ